MIKPTESPATIVGDVFENYASRGVFRAFSRGSLANGKATFKMVWHYNQPFECVLDTSRGTLRFPELLSNVPPNSPMHRAFKDYVKSRQSDALPEHRRIDPKCVDIKAVNRAGTLSLTVKSLNGDFEYVARKLINLVHEIFLDFLHDGRYFDYLIETFGLDPDQY